MKIFYGFILAISLSLSVAQEIVIEAPESQALPPPQLGIAPPRIEKTVKAGSALNIAVTLYNYNPKPKEIQISLIDTNATFQPIEPSEETLVPWTIINPTEFTLAGSGEQTIRLSIRPPNGFPSKTHHAMLQISQYVPDSIKFNTDGSGATVSIGSNYGLPIIVSVE